MNLPEIFYPEVQDPIAQLYNNIDFRDVTYKQFKDGAILVVINDFFLALNNQLLRVLPGDEVLYGALDKISDDPQNQLIYPEELLNSITPTGMPLYKLHLKNKRYHYVIEKFCCISRIV